MYTSLFEDVQTNSKTRFTSLYEQIHLDSVTAFMSLLHSVLYICRFFLFCFDLVCLLVSLCVISFNPACYLLPH